MWYESLSVDVILYRRQPAQLDVCTEQSEKSHNQYSCLVEGFCVRPFNVIMRIK
jgi:hypothetical protein